MPSEASKVHCTNSGSINELLNREANEWLMIQKPSLPRTKLCNWSENPSRPHPEETKAKVLLRDGFEHSIDQRLASGCSLFFSGAPKACPFLTFSQSAAY